jgi:hypothetical protein
MWSSPPSGPTPAVPPAGPAPEPAPRPRDRGRDDFDDFWGETRPPGDWAQSGDDLWVPGPDGRPVERRRPPPDGGGWSEADGVDGRGAGGPRRGRDWAEPDTGDDWRPPA